MLVRDMVEKDTEKVAEIEKKSFSNPWSSESLENFIKNETAICLVAEVEEELVAYCGCQCIADEGHIYNIVVDEKYRGRKIAKFLLEEVLARAMSNGISKFTLEVRKNNIIAINLYKSFGFESAGLRPGYYSEPREDALIMWLNGNIGIDKSCLG